MPAATTHNEFAKDVLQLIPNDFDFKINLPLFLLGAQGPDIFFFTGNWFPNGSLVHYGNQMHYEKIKEVILFMDNYTKTETSLRSYFYGYLCHYALDSCMHPLICWHARQMYAEKHISEDDAHFSLEAMIDIYILHQRGKNIKNYDVHHCLHIQKSEDILLTKMFYQLLTEVFHHPIKMKQLQNLGQNTYYTLYALKPSFLKFKIVQLFETITKNSKMISSIMLNEKTEPKNLIQEPHPPYQLVDVEKTATRIHGFDYLYQVALKNAIQLITSFNICNITTDFVGNPIIK